VSELFDLVMSAIVSDSQDSRLVDDVQESCRCVQNIKAEYRMAYELRWWMFELEDAVKLSY
jgi:hypothetical protein